MKKSYKLHKNKYITKILLIIFFIINAYFNLKLINILQINQSDRNNYKFNIIIYQYWYPKI